MTRKKLNFENSPTNTVEWLDSRIFEPNSNSYDRYLCVISISGLTFLEIVGWQPIDNYTTGKWDVGEGVEVLWFASPFFNKPPGINTPQGRISGRLLGHLTGVSKR